MHTRTIEIILMMLETDSHTTQAHDITLHYMVNSTIQWLHHAHEKTANFSHVQLTSHLWSLHLLSQNLPIRCEALALKTVACTLFVILALP